ncbi:hypothetical protein [Pseudomonas putida]|uniref:hypothetical protein n=1 Tax=Pseudomonas putida TaxID=303 RepID=UPI0011981EA2|nr:hypothetical protein [Pseudomonas putida]
MTVKITGCTFKGAGAGTGIRAPADADVLVEGSSFRNLGIGVDLYNQQLIQAIGLPARTCPAAFRELIEDLKAADTSSFEEIDTVTKKSKLASLMSGAEDVAKLSRNLFDLAKTGVDIVKLFGGV